MDSLIDREAEAAKVWAHDELPLHGADMDAVSREMEDFVGSQRIRARSRLSIERSRRRQKTKAQAARSEPETLGLLARFFRHPLSTTIIGGIIAAVVAAIVAWYVIRWLSGGG